jgi:uncharacterized protein (TIGR03437 family)
MKPLFAATAVLALPLAAQELRFAPVASGIAAPTDIQNARDGSGRLFLVQQNGLIRILQNGSVAQQPFLDIRSKTRAQGERGLLGLAFPPGFAQSQRFYVNYTDLDGDTVIAQYRVGSDRNAADAGSELVLLHIDQPFSNHNGGQLVFGPDGYLYIGMGDGGSGGDPFDNGQNGNTLLGKMLRVDVESEPGRVRIPPDNPFAAAGGSRPEIWALGLRNPWRFSFDRATGDLWIADVGQNEFEEVSFQPASSRGGENYGWSRLEGLHCYPRDPCSRDGFVLPVTEYGHGEGCSVTGGYVYRGRRSPGLRGIYFYGDLCSGRIWGVDRQGTGFVNRLLADSEFGITTFGEDEEGEIYVADANAGAILRIEGSAAPRFTSAGVVNAASFAQGLAPGSLATIFAAGLLDGPGIVAASTLPLPSALSGVSVTVNGVAAPLLAVAYQNGGEQVNFQVPFEISGQQTASLVVRRGAEASVAVNAGVVEPQPAVYTTDGTQAVAVHNADYTLVTPARPLQPGEFAFVYASGLGRVTNQPLTGSAAPLSPLAETVEDVQVTLGGVRCEKQFSGLAPGLAGVYQVNFRAPANLPAGSHDLILTVAGVSSPPVKVPVGQ